MKPFLPVLASAILAAAIVMGALYSGWLDYRLSPPLSQRADFAFYGDRAGGFLLDKSTGELWKVKASSRRARRVFLHPVDELLIDYYWSDVVESDEWSELTPQDRHRAGRNYLERLRDAPAWQGLSDPSKDRIRNKIQSQTKESAAE